MVQIKQGDLYVHCPLCDGQGMIFAFSLPPTEHFIGIKEHFDCPVCSATGEADRDKAIAWLKENNKEYRRLHRVA